MVNLDVMFNRAEQLYQKGKFGEALAQFKVIACEAGRKPGLAHYAGLGPVCEERVGVSHGISFVARGS